MVVEVICREVQTHAGEEKTEVKWTGWCSGVPLTVGQKSWKHLDGERKGGAEGRLAGTRCRQPTQAQMRTTPQAQTKAYHAHLIHFRKLIQRERYRVKGADQDTEGFIFIPISFFLFLLFFILRYS